MSIQPKPGIGFEAPPPIRSGKYDWATIEAACRAQPKQPYKVFTQDKNSLVSSLRQGSVRRMAAEHGFEYTTRHNTEVDGVRVCDLYVTYIPEQDKHRTTRKRSK